MVYGDIKFFDIIVFAGIAIFLIYRLRNVLGKRTGFEKKQFPNKKNEDVVLEVKDTNPDLKDGEKKLSEVYNVLPSFDHRQFLEGAKFAFETIINAFNKSDTETLKNLLTKDVLASFENIINEGGNNKGYQFYSLLINGVDNVFIDKNIISITLKITSEQFKDNDESTVIKKQDMWTFQKEINSNSPIWLLSST